MIHPERFYKHLSGNGIDFFTGVPDSLLKSLLSCFHQNIDPRKHIIAANEGLAVALASGFYISTGKLPLVYMQNSGLGNAINPLTSLADAEVYSIPMLLLIGWRGMPGKKDEPQHAKMGRITGKLLQALEIPVFILEDEEAQAFEMASEAISLATRDKKPVAILVPEGVFGDSAMQPLISALPLSRETALRKLIQQFTDEIIVCTTGKASREFFELNQERERPVAKTFLTVGSMGLANHVALGIHMHISERVVMVDGDGAILMHMGSMTAIGKWGTDSLVHIVINNGCHESVGAQPTLGFDIDLCAIARACGYTNVYCIREEHELMHWLQNGYQTIEKQFVEIKVNAESRSSLSRPTNTPAERKDELMKAIQTK